MNSADRGQGKSVAKVILAGEHFVVYHADALALPVTQLQTTIDLIITPRHGRAMPDEQTQDVETRLALEWVMRACRAHLGELELPTPPRDHATVREAREHLEQELEVRRRRALVESAASRQTEPFFLPRAEKRTCYWLKGIELHLTSNIPMAAGLGSSAAMAVACIRAWSSLVSAGPTEPELAAGHTEPGLTAVPTEPELAAGHTEPGLTAGSSEVARNICTVGRSHRWREEFELACTIERQLHGRSSGVDVAAVLADGPIVFRRPDLHELPPDQQKSRIGESASLCRRHPVDFVESVTASPEVGLLLVDSGQPGHTKHAVEHVAQWRQLHRRRFESLLGTSNEVVHRAAEALESGDVPALGRCLSEMQRLLAELGVSTPRIEELIAAAVGAGCLGAKLTGGGLGGCVVAICESRKISEVSTALARAGVDVLLSQPLGHPEVARSNSAVVREK